MLVGYVNPTTTRLAMVSLKNGGILLQDKARFDTADFKSLDAILERYLRKSEARGGAACLAVAGLVADNKVPSSYLPWSINGDSLAEKFGFESVRLVNEYIATAQGISELQPDQLFTINPGSGAAAGNRGIMGIDDHLCEAMMVFDGQRFTTFTTAGGHTGFSPASQLEVDLWQHLYTRHDAIAVTDIVSRGGLRLIYEFFLEGNQMERPLWFGTAEDLSARIIEEALSGTDEVAVDTVNLFVGIFASEATNLALRGVTTGGLYLGGRIVTELMPALDQGRFMEAFVKQGAMEDRLAAMPIYVLMDRQTALLGAAHIALKHDQHYE